MWPVTIRKQLSIILLLSKNAKKASLTSGSGKAMLDGGLEVFDNIISQNGTRAL